MKKQLTYRIIGIGLFHAVLYLFLVPFVIYPAFGKNGLVFTVIVAVIISITVLATIKMKRKKGD